MTRTVWMGLAPEEDMTPLMPKAPPRPPRMTVVQWGRAPQSQHVLCPQPRLEPGQTLKGGKADERSSTARGPPIAMPSGLAEQSVRETHRLAQCSNVTTMG